MRTYIFFTTILLATILISFAATGEEPTGYLTVSRPCNLEFPKDHGAHPGYRTEWWYYTGNLQAPTGEQFGFQLTFFRTQISPPGDRRKWPQPASAWRTQQIYLAHSAISMISPKQHLVAELTSREALNLAGTKSVDGKTTLYVKNWKAQIGPERHLLKVQTDSFGYEMALIPEKPPVMHGIGGYSRKGPAADQATCYYSISRFSAAGKLFIDDNIVEVSGSAWMDHEFGTGILGGEIQGWDWFSLQLSDNTEIMVAVVRKKDGGIVPESYATIIESAGQSRWMKYGQFTITVLDTWKSPESKAIYPASWRLQIPSDSIDLTIKARIPNQEMITLKSTGTIYWEGSVSATGTKAEKAINGTGYVELTGYSRAFDAPM